jgi:hypothetical protein
LSCVVSLGFEDLGDRDVTILETHIGSGQSHLRQSRSKSGLPGDERRATGCTTLVTIIVGKANALVGDPVDVGRPVAHDAIAVGADVGNPDVVTPEDEDVRAIGRAGGRGDETGDQDGGQECPAVSTPG